MTDAIPVAMVVWAALSAVFAAYHLGWTRGVEYAAQMWEVEMEEAAARLRRARE